MKRTNRVKRIVKVEEGTPPFKIGDEVTTKYFSCQEKENIIRKVTYIEKDVSCESGWRVSVDAGELCITCNTYPSAGIIQCADSGWFKKVEK